MRDVKKLLCNEVGRPIIYYMRGYYFSIFNARKEFSKKKKRKNGDRCCCCCRCCLFSLCSILHIFIIIFAIFLSSTILWTQAHSYVMMMKFLFPFCRSHSFFVWKAHHYVLLLAFSPSAFTPHWRALCSHRKRLKSVWPCARAFAS